jgi:hypothetical protein
MEKNGEELGLIQGRIKEMTYKDCRKPHNTPFNGAISTADIFSIKLDKMLIMYVKWKRMERNLRPHSRYSKRNYLQGLQDNTPIKIILR